MTRINKIIDSFVSLGKILAVLDSCPKGERLIREACDANPWFTPQEISSSARAIASEMLDDVKLKKWASRYRDTDNPRNVAVIMAGNIPFAGFFDLLCVLVAGHRCMVKYSSKDRVLMEFIVHELQKVSPGMPVEEFGSDNAPHAVIASGSNNAIRHLRSELQAAHTLYRSNRASVAVLAGNETAEQLAGLVNDAFTYSGLGCRNVSHLLLPKGYDIKKLANVFSSYPLSDINQKFINNFRQRKAVLDISGEPYIGGAHFILRESGEFPAALSEITYNLYSSNDEVLQWVEAREKQIQCVVSAEKWDTLLPFPSVRFGRAQYPTLYDYPDRVDTMKFLAGI